MPAKTITHGTPVDFPVEIDFTQELAVQVATSP
jgi:hypothetical protein